MNIINITSLNKCVYVITEKLDFAESYVLGFWFNTGSRDENLKNNGISHFIEHMMFKGTRKRSAKQISLAVEKNGAYLNAFTSKENTCYYARGLNNSLEKSFEILSDMIRNSLFEQKEIEKEANVIADELNDILDTPEEFIFDEFEKQILGDTSLGFPVIGTRENILAFNRGDLLEYFTKHYGNKELYIVAVGNVNHDKIVSLAEKYLTVPKCNKKKRKKLVLDNSKSFASIYRPVNQYYSVIGKAVSGFTSDLYLKIRLLSIILGEGSASRLFINLRENKGIAYQINSFVNGYSDASTLGIYFSTNPENRKKATDQIFSELNKLSRGNVKKSELEKAKKILLSNIVLGTEDLSGRMSRIANSYIYAGRIKSIEEVKNELNETTLSEINELSAEIFNPETFTQVEILSSELN